MCEPPLSPCTFHYDGAWGSLQSVNEGEVAGHYDLAPVHNCDDAYHCLGTEFTCAVLTNTYSWNCAGCACPGDTETSATDNWFDANLG